MTYEEEQADSEAYWETHSKLSTKIKYNLKDFVRNVSGMSDEFIKNASLLNLRATLSEFRTEARELKDLMDIDIHEQHGG